MRRGSGAAPAPLLHISSVGYFRRNGDNLLKSEKNWPQEASPGQRILYLKQIFFFGTLNRPLVPEQEAE